MKNYSYNNTVIGILPLLIVFMIMYFLIIRPQIKFHKEHRNLLDNLVLGDEILTNSGLIGYVSKLKKKYVLVEFSYNNNNTIKILIKKSYIKKILKKGTIKNLLKSKNS